MGAPRPNRDDGKRPAKSDGDLHAVVGLLKSADPVLRLHAVRQLGRFGSMAKEAVPQLCDLLLQEKGHRFVNPVLRALSKIGMAPDLAVVRIVEGLQVADVGMRRRIARVLAACNHQSDDYLQSGHLESLVAEMWRVVRDEGTENRVCLNLLLTLLEWENDLPSVFRELVRLLDCKSSWLRERTMLTLCENAQAAASMCPKVIKHLRREDYYGVWEQAAVFLGILLEAREHSELIISLLLEGLRNEDDVIREICAQTLGALGQRQRNQGVPDQGDERGAEPIGSNAPWVSTVVSALCAAFKDKRDIVRSAATESLRSLGKLAAQAVPTLLEARQDPLARSDADAALWAIAPEIIKPIQLNEAIGRLTTGRPRARKHSSVAVVARYLGEGKCQVGVEAPFQLEESEASVLQALIELGGTAKKPALINRSGVDDAPRVLRRIRKNCPQLAPYITLPGGKGRGGYRTSIRWA